MPVWPATLPQLPLRGGYARNDRSVVVRSQMDIGPAKTRRRTAVGVVPLMLTYHLSQSQLTTFRAFFANDIASGALSFDLPEPEGAGVISIRLTGGAGSPPFTITPRAPGYWDVSFAAEIMPT